MNVVCLVQEVVTFRTVDPAGADVYHTNVMMAIGTDVAVVCAEAVPDEKQRKHLLERLNRHHKVSSCQRDCSILSVSTSAVQQAAWMPTQLVSHVRDCALPPELRRPRQ